MNRQTATQTHEQKPPATLSASGLLQRQCACGNHTTSGGECEGCRKKGEAILQRSPSPSKREAWGEGETVPPIVHEVLRSSGQPLDASTRAFMEPRFGHDFSQVQTTTPQIATTGLAVGPASDRFEQEADRLSHWVMRAPAPDAQIDSTPPGRYSFNQVRVHTDAEAAESAQAVNALAYTVGNHVVFGAGQYAPTTTAGKHLLAHELLHTIQQGSSSAVVQRVCDPALLAGRTNPVFFPLEAIIVDVFRGVLTLTPSLTPKTAVGLVQQALVDLGFNLGTSGLNGDGVDRKFGTIHCHRHHRLSDRGSNSRSNSGYPRSADAEVSGR
jgi:hypothetical protein